MLIGKPKESSHLYSDGHTHLFATTRQCEWRRPMLLPWSYFVLSEAADIKKHLSRNNPTAPTNLSNIVMYDMIPTRRLRNNAWSREHLPPPSHFLIWCLSALDTWCELKWLATEHGLQLRHHLIGEKLWERWWECDRDTERERECVCVYACTERAREPKRHIRQVSCVWQTSEPDYICLNLRALYYSL